MVYNLTRIICDKTQCIWNRNNECIASTVKLTISGRCMGQWTRELEKREAQLKVESLKEEIINLKKQIEELRLRHE